MSNFLVENVDFKNLLGAIPKSAVDLILTDPPYKISRKTGFKSIGKKSVERFAVSMDFGKWDHKEIDLNILAKESYRCLRQGGTIICFYDLWKITKVEEAFSKAGFKMIRLIIWEKTNPVPLNSKKIYLSNSREVAVLGVKEGKPTFHSEYDNGIYSLPIHREKRHHPTQKPLRLIEELIKKHSKPKDLIVDCFMGSGTTGLACLNLERDFIGCDIDKKYTKIAKKQLAEHDKKTILLKTSKTKSQWLFKEGLCL